MEDYTNISEQFPFLSCIKFQDTKYLGIIQNSDQKVLSIYDFNLIKSDEEKRQFLEYGEIWWWESARRLPINIFLHGAMIPFRYCMRTMPNKDVSVVFGPMPSLNNLLSKRSKRRQIQLVVKIK